MSRDVYSHTSWFPRFPFKWVNGLYSGTGYQPHYILHKYLLFKCLLKHPLDPITAVTECTTTEHLREAIINACPPPPSTDSYLTGGPPPHWVTPAILYAFGFLTPSVIFVVHPYLH